MAVVLPLLTSCSSVIGPAGTQATPAESGRAYHDSKGHFGFRVPAGWQRVPEVRMQRFNNASPKVRFDLGFQGSRPIPYFLGQIRRVGRESSAKVSLYIAHATRVDDLHEIPERIRDGSYVNRDLFYEKNGFFIWVIEYRGRRPDLSIMAKKFCSYGYVMLHYYFNSDDPPEAVISGLKDWAEMIDTFTFDQGYEFDARE